MKAIFMASIASKKRFLATLAAGLHTQNRGKYAMCHDHSSQVDVRDLSSRLFRASRNQFRPPTNDTTSIFTRLKQPRDWSRSAREMADMRAQRMSGVNRILCPPNLGAIGPARRFLENM